MKKILLLILLCAISVCSEAQTVEANSEVTEKKTSKYSGEFDLYLQNAWGVGLMIRKELNPCLEWNIFGASFMSGWGRDETPDKVGIVNARLMGLRAHANVWKNLGVYAEATPGYTYRYSSKNVTNYYYGDGLYYSGNLDSKAHYFGLDCGAGILLGKHLGLGYNFSFFVNKNGNDHIHWGRVSIIF
jgi:hypothetical protein